MNRQHRIRLTIGAVAALAALTGCSGTGGAASGGVAATPADAATASVTPGASAAAGPGTASTGNASGGNGAAASRCTLDDLKAELSAPAGPQNQRTVRVVWTNSSGRDCTMTGFGGADIRRTPSPDRSELSEAERRLPDSYSLRRSEKATPTVRLTPGTSAHSTITYLTRPTTDVLRFEPDVVVVTPPDETRSVTLRWNGGGLDPADSATRPGTYLGPVEPGAS